MDDGCRMQACPLIVPVGGCGARNRLRLRHDGATLAYRFVHGSDMPLKQPPLSLTPPPPTPSPHPLGPTGPAVRMSRRRAAHLLTAVPWLGGVSLGYAQSQDAAQLKQIFPARIFVCSPDVPLALNGAGVRYKAMFRVYAAGLYLEQPARTLEEVTNQPGCKRLAITMLRNIHATELGNLFTQGLHANTDPSQTHALLPNMLRMGELFARYKTLQAGQHISIDRLPGKGMVLRVDNAPQPEPFETAFFDALMRIWLGEHPADTHLRTALLGGEPVR